MIRFDVNSTTGKLLDSKDTLVEAERLLGAWFDARFVIEVGADGSSRLAAERKELHNPA